MIKTLQGHATPLITGLFVASLVAGVGPFFHVAPGGVHPMHEWLSMFLIVPFVLHFWKNWRPRPSDFRHAPMAIVPATSSIVAGYRISGTDKPLAAITAAFGRTQAELAAILVAGSPR